MEIGADFAFKELLDNMAVPMGKVSVEMGELPKRRTLVLGAILRFIGKPTGFVLTVVSHGNIYEAFDFQPCLLEDKR